MEELVNASAILKAANNKRLKIELEERKCEEARRLEIEKNITDLKNEMSATLRDIKELTYPKMKVMFTNIKACKEAFESNGDTELYHILDDMYFYKPRNKFSNGYSFHELLDWSLVLVGSGMLNMIIHASDYDKEDEEQNRLIEFIKKLSPSKSICIVEDDYALMTDGKKTYYINTCYDYTSKIYTVEGIYDVSEFNIVYDDDWDDILCITHDCGAEAYNMEMRAGDVVHRLSGFRQDINEIIREFNQKLNDYVNKYPDIDTDDASSEAEK